MTQDYANQRVGIGTPTSSSELDVAGDVQTSGHLKIGSGSTVCDSSAAGTIRYNASSQDLEFCDGADWKLVGDGGTPACGGTVDYEGQTYDTVEIGTQCWFAENLNVGTMINGTTEPTNNATIEKWCYDNSSTNCTNEGAFYNWNEMMAYTTTEGAQGICPSGWHIPTDAEQYTLDNYLATGICDANRLGWECDPAGTALKSGGSSNFNAILGGYRHDIGSFFNQGTLARLWSSSESGTNAFTRSTHITLNTVNRSAGVKAYGFSVRCLQD